MKMIRLDGSYGEGGGQVLRSALALSMVTGKPFRIDNIRAGRKKPGLMRQHLTAADAAVQVCSGHSEGNSIGSRSLQFEPGPVKPGRYRFSIGSAGSCTLVLQTVLPVLLTASAPSELILEGGTHNPFAPPFDFLEKCFFRTLEKMGPRFSTTLERAGFYPAGGGRFTVRVEPATGLSQMELINRGEILDRRGRAIVSGLPVSIAKRELRVLRDRLGWEENCFQPEEIENPRGPGNIVFAEVASEAITEVFTGFGERGVSAEAVAGSVAKEVAAYLEADVPVGSYLADQLLIPLALAGGGRFRTLRPSRHTQTNVEVIKQFLGVGFDLRETGENRWDIEIRS